MEIFYQESVGFRPETVDAALAAGRETPMKSEQMFNRRPSDTGKHC